ncbi:MAG: hypothetical protein K2K83_00500 [Rikenella sp.]|nr:hypothetical protein [Rikenella sp.]
MFYVGSHGFSWAASVTDLSTYRFDFTPDGVYPNNSNHRAHGFQLRCLQE